MNLRSLVWLASLSSVFAQDETTVTFENPSTLSATSASVNGSSSLPIISLFPTASSASETSVSETPVSSSTSLEYTTQNPIPISSYSFEPFPVPSPSPQQGFSVVVDPLDPPKVGKPVIPDFSEAWAVAYQKALQKVSNFTLEEKVNVTTGVGWEVGRCVGNIDPIEPSDGRGWPGLCLQDSPLGVRWADYVTAFPSGVNAAATWNRRLIRERGLFMGKEFRGKGIHVALGPMMNMARVAQGGRNYEGFGGDPYLVGEASYETILGMQEAGIQACAKHLVNNEQEHKRTTSTSDVDDRTQHEIYTHPFLRSVMAGVASMMCSYNLINGTYACENDKVMNDIVKREYGFQGYIMSDWQATHSTVSAITGLDMTMPGDITFYSRDSYFGGNLTAYVQNGTIPESRVDDMATRIIAAWYFVHQDDASFPEVNFDGFRIMNDANNSRIDVQDDHYKLVREMGAASTVLLKNVDGALPLKKPRSILLAGSDAGPGRIGPNQFPDRGGSDGVLAMGWGSGTADFTYLITPLEAIQRRARKDRTSVSWILDDFDLPAASNLAIGKSASLVFISADSGEEFITVDGNQGDRKNLTSWHGGEDLILAVAAQNNNTIVIAHSVGPLIVESWIDHPNITAVLWAGLPGTEAGNALTDVLYGDWNPSGRLPYTIAKQPEDYSAQLLIGDQDILVIPYTEGLEIDYRHFDAKNITPRFEFGFGLSYTNWSYSDLKVATISSGYGDISDSEAAWEAGGATLIEEGSSTALWLHRPAYKVTFKVTNTGDVFGGDIPQLYLNFPSDSGEPPSVLKGFTNVELLPGHTHTTTLLLSRYDVSIWDTTAQGWRKPNGTIGVSVGRSSRDFLLFGELP